MTYSKCYGRVPFSYCVILVCLILTFKTDHAWTYKYKPKTLDDFSSLQGSVLFGSRVRYDVVDLSLCNVSFPAGMNITEFTMEIQSAEINADEEFGTVVTSHEQEVFETQNGKDVSEFFQRHTQASIRADGSATVRITDFQPMTFKVIRRGELFCTWRNYTAFNLTKGMTIWGEQWQSTEMGIMDRLQEAVKGGNLMYFYVNANQLQPPQYRSHWSGYIKDFNLNGDTAVFYSPFLNQNILIMTEIIIMQDANVTVNRYVINRATNSYVTRYTMKGVFGYDTAVHFYWTGLFWKG